MPMHHLVFFRFKPEACTPSIVRDISIGTLKLLCIPGVTAAAFGKTLTMKRSLGFTHHLHVIFSSRSAFENKDTGWKFHPLHKEWGRLYVRPNIDGPAEGSIRKLDIETNSIPFKKKVDCSLTYHTVFFQMKSDFSEYTGNKAIDLLNETLNEIPGVLYTGFNKAFIRGIGNIPYQWGLTVIFKSRKCMEHYSTHPKHLQWLESIKSYIVQTQCLDIEEQNLIKSSIVKKPNLIVQSRL